MPVFAATDAPLLTGRHEGVVVEFDAFVGLGYVSAANSDKYLFHCIEIADGSRDIEVGCVVSFETIERFQHAEARQIVKGERL
jgi:CspA family cold shock protein